MSRSPRTDAPGRWGARAVSVELDDLRDLVGRLGELEGAVRLDMAGRALVPVQTVGRHDLST